MVIGGGFIGLEMVENLVERGLDFTLLEKLDQVMPPLDPELARIVKRYMGKHGINLRIFLAVCFHVQSLMRIDL